MAEKEDAKTIQRSSVHLEVNVVDNYPRSRSIRCRLVANGLKVKFKSPDQQLHQLSFDYITPFLNNHNLPASTDWYILTADNVQEDHIRIHELKEGDDLFKCAKEYQESHAKAMAVINITCIDHRDCIITPDPNHLTQKLDNFVVAILPHAESKHLHDCFKNLNLVHHEAQVMAKIDVVSSGSREKDATVDEAACTKEIESNLWDNSLQAKKNSKDFNFKREIMEMMFDDDKMHPVSMDRSHFIKAMELFTKYEKMGKRNSSQVSEFIKRIGSHLDDSFSSEFPFYLVLIYRLRKFHKNYECDELTSFINKCMMILDEMAPSDVAGVLQLFYQKKDFYILFGQEDSYTSVFAVLADASQNMMPIFIRQKPPLKNVASKGVVYSKLMWISIHLKFVEDKMSSRRDETELWDTDFLKTSKEIEVSSDIVRDLKLGVEFSQCLNLLPEHQFTVCHLTQFLANRKFIRPLSHVRDVVIGLKAFINTEEDIFCLMTNLRAQYIDFFSTSGKTFIKHASVEKTVQGTLDEGMFLIDDVNELWYEKRWNKGDKHQNFIHECLNWMLLLLKTFSMTDANAPLFLKKFFVPKTGSMMADSYFQNHIADAILEKTRFSFHLLTIQVFFPLLNAHAIWSISFLQDYLKHYPIPDTIRINDPIWSNFFNIVLECFQSDKLQSHVKDFLIEVAHVYKKNKRACIFITDLLQLNTPNLLSSDTEGASNGKNISVIEGTFSYFLLGYIQQNNLRPELMRKIDNIIESISENEQISFHCFILNVLQSEVIPELSSFKKDKRNAKQLMDSLKQVIKILGKISCLEILSPKQKFCWGVVNAASSKIPVTTESFQWACDYQTIIQQLGNVFRTYCDSRNLSNQACLLSEPMPDEIEHCTWKDVKKYFQWVQQVQTILCRWHNKFETKDVNYDEILMYAENCEAIDAVGYAVCAKTYVLDKAFVLRVKEDFALFYEQLNCSLLLYVPGHPEVKYCTLLKLLLFYGVSIPVAIQEALLEDKIIFPGNVSNESQRQQLDIIFPSAINNFNPGQDISLSITKSVSLFNLKRILKDLTAFLKPIANQMDMLVFFHLHKSEIFEKHLLNELESIMTESLAKKTQWTSGNLHSSTARFLTHPRKTSQHPQEKGIPITTLQRGLDQVKCLLVNIIKGTATYSDIVISGKFDLETLNAEDEFTILSESSHLLKVNPDSWKGLDGVKCMLELFQFASHIIQIKQVCEQYGLEQCLQDENLKKIISFVEELKLKQSRDFLTPIEAKNRMGFIKEVLCLGQSMNYNSLDIFPAVADSAAFYQFIKDKKFFGSKGQAIFYEQYQLITAQLQHEEYDENVLNHLMPAYQLIVPFMEANIKFTDLMNKLTNLDTTNGLKQLKTVNENVTLISLWFSRAEGDTIENVAMELQNILRTGVFSFQLNSASNIISILLTYKYQSMLPQRQESITEKSTEDSVNNTGDNEEILSVPGKWSSEKIADFVIKLGFLDAKKEGGDKIQQFLHLNSTANKILDLLLKLHKLGHPHYRKNEDFPVLQCSVPAAEIDDKVGQIQQTVIEWQNQLAALHQKFIWLLFFSIPKALNLYSLLEKYRENPELYLDSIVLEVSFLFKNKQIVWTKLESVIKDMIIKMQKKINKTTPMKYLGEFLHLVCGSEKLKVFLCKRRSSSQSDSTLKMPRTSSVALLSGSLVGTYQLHYAPGYSQSQLICLITQLYKGVPECYEVFHCRSSTTQEEVHLLLERIKHHHLTYLVLMVNKLSFILQELLITLLKHDKTTSSSQCDETHSTVHFIETSPSALREVPWINYEEYKSSGPDMTLHMAGDQYRHVVFHSLDFTDIQLVYGHAGDGKTHYIRQKLTKSPAQLTVAINEAFTPLYAINCLNTLPHSVCGCAVFFNFTLMPYQEFQDETEKNKSDELLETIGWFFYHLLVLGYVEDQATGTSFRFPGGQEWAIYIEVPSLDHNHSPEESLQRFNEKFPILCILGSKKLINADIPITIDEDVQLVCKYLKAYKIGGLEGIDRLCQDSQRTYSFSRKAKPLSLVKFSEDPDLPDKECNQLLKEYMPKHTQHAKISQKLFIRYMKRRCAFLDTLPAFNYNIGKGETIKDDISGEEVTTDTRKLGSTLMRTMIEEASTFCDQNMKRNWTGKSYQQLIYDFRDGTGSFGLLSLVEKMPKDRQMEYKNIGFELHTFSQLRKRKFLDQILARVLGLPSEDEKHLSIIDEYNYVLTVDYAIKMLNIHERHICGMPVIIKGETGVGKTALVEMLSRLWNNALLRWWNKEKKNIVEAIQRLMKAKVIETPEDYKTCKQIADDVEAGKIVSVRELMIFGELKDKLQSKRLFTGHLRQQLLDMEKNPAITFLMIPSPGKGQYSSLTSVFESAREKNTVQSTAILLHAVLKAELRKTFHKLNVHTALTPCDIKEFFDPVFRQAKVLKKACMNADESNTTKTLMPFITVFLDEVNTSSCLGLFKEIIVDKTLDGKAIPDNVFIVAACNPHRGNSMATHADETWLGSTYYVKSLHPTLEYLMWDYESLDKHQEREYIIAKMQMLHKESSNIDVVNLTDPIIKSQSLMREYALKQLIKQGMHQDDAEVSSKSCVSQRDIQRVFTFYQWLMCVYNKLNRHSYDRSRRAVMVSLGIVYYMRLNREYRKEYERQLNRTVEKLGLPGAVLFSTAFKEELDYFCENIKVPPGIAKTQALKENVFATIACTVTHTPLVIVGAPGTSKTLSFNLVISSLKGLESKTNLFRDVEIFKSLDPHYYQCSRQTNSNEIETVFSHAINRQRSHEKFSLPIYCVVFMDEAGLPEESHESLKVLHYHLDKQEVSFVAITNHVLDAAKTNRAVSLFRPDVSEEDLEVLAKGCLTTNPEEPPAHLKQDLETIVRFCPAYSQLMKDPKLRHFFGLRDFIHFVNYLRKRRTEGITPQLVIQALERNFNGICWSNKDSVFKSICESFIKTMSPVGEKKVITYNLRNILDVIKETLEDNPEGNRDENEVRYKLVIDPTEDNSLMHLLIAFGVLDRKKTRMYVCSDFSGDSQIQKINTIAGIRHSAIQGHTVVMSQTDDIHESFYDLFNQRFRRIDDPDPKRSPRYYTNIAIGPHLKPCRVDPKFSCIVVVKQTEVDTTPPPFLNRFEKYFISHEILLNTALNHLDPCVRIILQTAREKVNGFIELIGKDNNNIYGLKPQTLDSLLLSMLPPYGHIFKETAPPEDPIHDDVKICLLHELLRALRNSAGFVIPPCSIDELKMDAKHLFSLLDNDAEFVGVLNSLSLETPNSIVNEALNLLHTAPDPNEKAVFTTEISEEACLVVSIMQQWLICHLSKTLMQLMTPEAICLHHKKIPTSLVENYLTNQHHFSLKKLIEYHLSALESSQISNYLCPNKLICFTRSSSNIHQLPTTNLSPTVFKESLPDDEDVRCLKELIYDDPAYVQICQVTSVQSQTAIQEMLKSFSQEPKRKILLLIINMQEVTTGMVNHLKVMIEEAEAQTLTTSTNKLFVLLLHFPLAMFFDACYPALFLRGWNYYYLDSIGQRSTHFPGKLGIEEWFQRCCSNFSDEEFVEDNLLQTCIHLLPEVIPVLVSCVTFGSKSTGPFTRDMNAGERSKKLEELLFDKGVGQKLCHMFRSCWHPNVMVECLEQAARFAESRESCLNISDALQSKFYSLFTDFMVVMVNEINTDHNLDILFSKDVCSEVEELFLSLMQTINLPKLNQTKMLARTLPQPRPQEYQQKFPFFNIVCDRLSQLIGESHTVLNREDDLLEEFPEMGTSARSQPGQIEDSRIQKFANLVIKTMHKQLQEGEVQSTDPLLVAISFIRDHSDQLWDRYFSDFIYHSLHLDITASLLSREVICTFYSELLELPPIERLVYLHISVDYDRMNLTNICSLLNPLEKICKVAQLSPLVSLSEASSSGNDYISVFRENKAEHPFGDPQMMSNFIISALFSVLVKAVEGTNNQMLKAWYQTYQCAVSVSVLKSHLYMTLFPGTEKAKFNIMHTTFALMLSYPILNEHVLVRGNTLFNKLLQKYLTLNLQLKDSEVIPSLSDCSQIAGELMKDDVNDSSTKRLTQKLQEELFNHFFSPYRTSYSSQDRDWFLRLVNRPGTITNLTMAIYKRYLSLILGCPSKNESQKISFSNPLMMYDTRARQNVADVLSAFDDGGKPGPYIPTFYWNCQAIMTPKSSESPLMQQPLCHLYFATLMEHLIADPRSINALLQLAGIITQVQTVFSWFILPFFPFQHSKNELVPLGDKIISQIEKQAVIQCLLQELASFYSENNVQVKEVVPVMDELNHLLNESMGGVAIEGHGLTLGMHLLHKLRSYRLFTELFTTKYPLIREIKFVHVLHERLGKAETDSKPYFLPFMYQEDHSSTHKTLSKLYVQIKSAVLKIHDTQSSIDQLLLVDNKCWNKSQKKLNRRQAFKMILWLVIYFEFFAKKKSFSVLSNILDVQKLKCCSNDEVFIQLIRFFLKTESLAKNKEALMSQRENTQGGHSWGKASQEKDDVGPLFNLFNGLSSKDQSDQDLSHCLANLVGVVLGCPPRSNHLWYHLFSPDELKDTYMPGFMYDAKISPEGLFYDCGVQLTPDGQYGRLDYISHATRGTYSLHSLYFILWANFGTFCVSLLTQPDSQSKIHGILISDQLPIRHYCVSQVKSMWNNLKNSLSLSDEERVILVNGCLMNLYKLTASMDPAELSPGKFQTQEQCDHYETVWHERVFTPACKELQNELNGHLNVHQNAVLSDIQQLETYYPQYPSELDFLNYMHGLKVDNDCRLLTRFVLEKQRLEVGGQLLPILIQLYQWLHTHLSNLVTPKSASNKLTIGKVIEILSKKVNPSLKELYQNVKGLYNTYIGLMGGAIGNTAVRHGSSICTIEDNVPLIHFLSDTEKEDSGNDWLFAVIRDIAETHNDIILTLYTTAGNVKTGEHHLAHLLPQDHSYIHLSEANEHNCLVPKDGSKHGLTEYLQLVRARLESPIVQYIVKSPFDTQPRTILPCCSSLSLNLAFLQGDIIAHYLSGKPSIKSINSLRIVFKFKQERKSCAVKNKQDSDPMGTVFDIMAFRDNLPQEYCAPLKSQDLHSLEYEFHSANYHILSDVINGLRTAVGLLIMVLTQDNNNYNKTLLLTTSLCNFISNQYQVAESNQYQLLELIGIKKVSSSQLQCISSTKLPFLFSTLELFVGWIKGGLYDFSSVPMALKAQFKKADLAELEKIHMSYPGPSVDLLTELNELVEALLHAEPYIVKKMNEISQKQLMEVLSSLSLLSNLDRLPSLIPCTVLVQHYVKFRMILRKLTSITKQKVALATSFQDINQKQWSETVDDLWSRALPHLRVKGFVFVDPTTLLIMSTTDSYGFYGDNWKEEKEEETESKLDGELNIDSSLEGSLEKSHEQPMMISERKRKVDIEQEAKDWTPQMISQFLENCGMKKHAETFLEEDIDGLQLLVATRNVYKALGVSNCVEYAQIAVLFKRKLMGVETIHCTVSDLIKANQKLSKHKKTLEEARVDGDVLQFAEEEHFLEELLNSVGIPSDLDINRFRAALKKAVPQSTIPAKGNSRFSGEQEYRIYSTPV